jgi:hypothetical protein
MIDGTMKEATRLVEKTQEVDKESKEIPAQKDESRQDDQSPEVNHERIARMKKAFRPTWLHDQINSNGNGKGSVKKD